MPMKEIQNKTNGNNEQDINNDCDGTTGRCRSVGGIGGGCNRNNRGGDDFTSYGNVVPSRTTTTLLQYHTLTTDLPPIYQPQHRASI